MQRFMVSAEERMKKAFDARRFSEALEIASAGGWTEPTDNLQVASLIARSLRHLGEADRASSYALACSSLPGIDVVGFAWLAGEMSLRAGRWSNTAAAMDRCVVASRASGSVYFLGTAIFIAAYAYARLGDRESTLRCLHDPDCPSTAVIPGLGMVERASIASLLGTRRDKTQR